MNTFDFDEVVEQYYRALGEFVKGNPEPISWLLTTSGA
jgi:hypothetical protein